MLNSRFISPYKSRLTPAEENSISFSGGASLLQYCAFDHAEIQVFISEYADATKVSHCVFRGGKDSISTSGEAIIENNLFIGSMDESIPAIYIGYLIQEGTWIMPGNRPGNKQHYY